MGERIKNRRKAIGLSQQELADAVGISRNALSRIELSPIPNMTVYTAMRIAKALGVTMDFLIYGECLQMCAEPQAKHTEKPPKEKEIKCPTEAQRQFVERRMDKKLANMEKKYLPLRYEQESERDYAERYAKKYS